MLENCTGDVPVWHLESLVVRNIAEACMSYEELADFITNKMSMSHIYQPLLIRTLIESGGLATLRQLAQQFVLQDESQLLFYEQRVKEMPVRVLAKHGVLKQAKGLVSLNVSDLSLEQKAHIRMLCEQRLQEYIQKRGLAIWDYRMLDTVAVSDDLRFQVLKRSDGRCALCGATKNERPLDVDHIIPRSRGGKTLPENLQLLCSKCNRTKGNKDDTDFRAFNPGERVDGCPFCLPPDDARIVMTNATVFAIADKYPVTEGHTLIVSVRHAADYLHLSAAEKQHADELIRVLSNKIRVEDSTVSGFNIGMNCGHDAGQTVMHAHIHLIPRRHDDVPDPRGGVRGVVPERRIPSVD
jgi:diadenosine tetraphosphate (Ap4A) HIT family hydrolase